MTSAPPLNGRRTVLDLIAGSSEKLVGGLGKL